MAPNSALSEFRTDWLPHVTDAGLSRLIDLLQSGSPLLIHGAFTHACAMGCLATHIGWHHPTTAHLNDEAGVRWLTKVAGLNPATSSVITTWDQRGATDWSMRAEILRACQNELENRREVGNPEAEIDCTECVGC
jgi:hypothetical protein